MAPLVFVVPVDLDNPAGTLWILLIGAGSRTLLNYDNTQGQPGSPPEKWPVASRIVPAPQTFTLLMTLHPKCTCSFATLAELQEFLARAPQRPATHLLFHSEGVPSASALAAGALWQRAAAIPGVTLIPDDGTEAALFRANTSGQTMLYGPPGNLRFTGGITAARGHQGENYGLAALLAALQPSPQPFAKPAARPFAQTPAQLVASAPVFGCPLHDPPPETLQKDASWKRR